MAKAPKSQRLKALATYRLLAARARVVLGTAKVQNKTLNALAKVAALSAVSNSKKLSASVQASLLVTGAKTGKFFTLINLEDTLTATEIRNFNLSKLAVNEVNAVDRALAEVYKALADETTTSELVTASVGKAILSAAATFEQLTRDSDKVLADPIAAIDAPAKHVSTNRDDAFTVSEQATLRPEKQVLDAVSTADVLSRTVAFVRVFNDITDATDEINANLLLDDGQIMFLQKNIRSNTYTATQLTIDTDRLLSDVATTNEEALLLVAKQLDDLVGFGDFDVYELDKALGDSFSTDELVTRDSTKALQDSAVVDETATRDFYKTLSDTVTTADGVRFFLDAYYETGVATSEDVEVVRIAAGGVPPQLDNQFLADTASLGVNKNFYDNVGVTDDVYGEANVDDDQITFVGKNLPEPVLTSELRTVGLQRILAETATVGSSGVLALTDYCDSTYFSQAYVGTERIFS